MTAAQRADLVRQVADAVSARITPELNKLERRMERLARKFRNHDRKADGEADAGHPWLRLSRAHCCQVEDVYRFLLAHKDDPADVNTIARACRATFCPIKSGYKSVESLQSYCYALPITDFV